jgi:5-methylcytosine-specific restriction endonuclease McrA
METIEFLISLPYVEYLNTKWWDFTRRRRLEIDKYKCKQCGGIHELEVHHLSYENLGDENIYTDLITLCSRCHNDEHYFKKPEIKITKEMVLQQSEITEQEYEAAKICD